MKNILIIFAFMLITAIPARADEAPLHGMCAKGAMNAAFTGARTGGVTTISMTNGDFNDLINPQLRRYFRQPDRDADGFEKNGIGDLDLGIKRDGDTVTLRAPDKNFDAIINRLDGWTCMVLPNRK